MISSAMAASDELREHRSNTPKTTRSQAMAKKARASARNLIRSAIDFYFTVGVNGVLGLTQRRLIL